MNPKQDRCFKLGMRYRRDGNTIEEVMTMIEALPMSQTVYSQQIINGWFFMDNYILAQEMLEGRA